MAEETRQQYVGGIFAPPLTDQLMVQYRAAIDKMGPQSPLFDSLDKLYKCCDKWWNIPESVNGDKTPHPVGRGTIQKLDKSVAAALWDDIPWQHELAALGGAADGVQGLYDHVQADVCVRNSVRVQDWQRSVYTHVIQKHFPDPSVYARIAEAAKNMAAWIGLLSDAEQVKLKEQEAKAVKCSEEIAAAISTKEYGSLPYPTLESTELRDMAFHLLWHVIELDRDREPLTTDRL